MRIYAFGVVAQMICGAQMANALYLALEFLPSQKPTVTFQVFWYALIEDG
jgi:hypothetical protein